MDFKVMNCQSIKGIFLCCLFFMQPVRHMRLIGNAYANARDTTRQSSPHTGDVCVCVCVRTLTGAAVRLPVDCCCSGLFICYSSNL